MIDNKAKDAFQKRLDIRTTFHADYGDIEQLVGDIFNSGKRVNFLEAGNDRVYSGDADDALDIEEMKEIEDRLKEDNGDFETYRLTDVLSWLATKGYIDKGEYIIDVCW